MKLIRLKLLSPFRSLTKGFELHFREDNALRMENLAQFHPFCFAGLNGSGKSNILEALSMIFFFLECRFSKYLPDAFNEVFGKYSLSFSFELEYLHFDVEENENNIFIRYDNNELEFYINQERLEKGVEPKREGEFKEDALAKQYLPQIVVGYSSGENEILSLPFLKTGFMHYDYYEQSLLNEEYYQDKALTSLIYIDYGMSQSVLLSNFLMQNPETLKPIKEVLQIEKLHSFRLYIRDFNIKDKEMSDADKHTKKLLSQITPIIDKLKRCATCSFQQDENTLILDYYVNEVTKKAFNLNFKEPYELFKAFQTLIELNTHSVDKRVKEDIYKKESMYLLEKKPKPKEEQLAFYFNNFFIKKKNIEKPLLVKNLSDGEHQFLHSMGICLMLKDKSALLLLDEPETHFNPEWRSRFISMLNQSLEKGGSNNLTRDILITSHSPFIISDCFPDKVIVFEKGQQPVNARELGIDTFGASVNILTNKIFGQKHTIGKYALDKIESFRLRSKMKNENIDMLVDEINEEIGDSIEKLLLIKEIKDIKNA